MHNKEAMHVEKDAIIQSYVCGKGEKAGSHISTHLLLDCMFLKYLSVPSSSFFSFTFL